MRLWSIDIDKYGDKSAKSRWRKETIQALDLFRRNGMRKDGKGISPYWRHSGLTRWKKERWPIVKLLVYLSGNNLLLWGIIYTMPVTTGQIAYEFAWLQHKLYSPVYRKGKMIKEHRDLEQWKRNKEMVLRESIMAHPFFRVVPGDVEPWERVKVGITQCNTKP